MLNAQAVNNQIKDVVMPSANAASLGKYGDIPVSYYTGVPNVGIPITTIQDGSLSLPISLSYHAGGVKVGEVCSSVGLGWSLQAGGMISRTVQGIADERENGYFKIGYDIAIVNGCIVRNSNGGNVTANATFNGQLASGQMDGEPDIFSFSVGGYNGKFFIDKAATSAFGTGKVVLIQKQDVKIEYAVVQDFTETALKKFTITTPDGVKYEFGDISDGSPAIEVTRPVSTNNGYANGWYLKRITTPDNKSKISLNYIREIYAYGYRTSNGSALTGTTITPLGGYGENVINILGYRLDNIITSTGVEKITFVTNGDRTDVKTSALASSSIDNAKKVGAIKVENGGYCKTFTLTQSYFTDNSAKKSGQDTDNRLRLDKVQEAPCIADINTQTVEPFTFTYYGQAGNIDYLPNRLSAAIDHWGYANGASTNPVTGLNIPYTRLKYFDPRPATGYPNGRNFDDVKGSSNRETDEANMTLGTIQQINYPTGGNTKFEYEANTYYDPTGVKTLATENTISYFLPDGQCNTVINPPQSIVTTITLPENMFFTLRHKRATAYTGTCSQTNTITLTLFNNTTNAVMCTYEVVPNSVVDPSITSATGYQFATISGFLTDIFPCLTSTGSYRIQVQGWNSAAEFTLQKEVTLNVSVGNRKVGGLRIKKITNNNGISTANDVVKTYDYGTPNSSGMLYQKPFYGYAYTGTIGQCNGVPTQDIYTGFFMDNAIVPLGSFEGGHLNYNTVKENYVVGGTPQYYTTYTYNNEALQPFTGIPITPTQPRIGSGELISKQQFNNSSTLVASETNSPYTTDVYEQSTGTFIKFNGYNQGPVSTTISFWKSYQIRNKPYRLSKTTSNVDGVETITDYSYDASNVFLSPVEQKVTSSDGKVYTTKTFYAHTFSGTSPDPAIDLVALGNIFLAKNMIAIPLKTEQYTGTTLTGGSVLLFKKFEELSPAPKDAIIFPYKSYSINKDGTLNLNMTVNAYDRAMPSQMTAKGFAISQTFGWDASKRLVNKSFGGLNWVIDYYGTSTLVKAMTDENGLRTKFTYDALMRLSKTQNRFSGTIDEPQDIQATIDYQYQYKNANNLYSFVGTSSTFKGVTAPLSTKQYMDGLGRPIEVVKELYTPPSTTHPNDYWHQKNYVAYDALGRQNKSYLPFESNTLSVELPPAYTSSYVLTEYETSPLSRPIKQTNVDNTVVTTNYGTNVANDVRLFVAAGGSGGSVSGGSFYAANTLYKTTMTDENAKQTYIFKDKLGRVILTRKFLSSQNIDTYNVYDDYSQLVAVLPPGSVDANGAVTNSLTFQYVYDNQNRLSQKKIPGAEPQKFYYDNRDLLVLTQDGNMAAENATKHLATLYDDIGRVVKTGFAFVSPTQGQNFTLTDAQITDKLTETIYYPNKTWVKHQGAKVLKPTGVSTNTDFVWSYIERRVGLEYTGNPVWIGKQHLLYPSVAQRPIDDNDVYGVDWSVSGYNGMQQADLSIRYLFTGTSAAEVRTRQDFTYDNGRRMTDAKYAYTLNGASLYTPTFTLSNMVYNYKDQLEEKNIGLNGANALQSIDYTYNLRGWLTAINNMNMYGNNTPIMTPPMSGQGYIQNLAISPFISKAINESLKTSEQTPPLGAGGLLSTPPPMADNNTDLFSQALTYGSPDSRTGVTPQYNGNISSTTWQILGRDKQAYGFKYDDMDRLTESKYFDITDSYNSSNHQWSSSYSTDYKFNESSTYDVRGNITFLQRNGLNGGSWTGNGYTAATYGLIDNLTYNYNGQNQVTKVVDASLANKGFIYKNASVSTAFTYDTNGNLTSDANKGITSIEYNYLNLPMKIVFNRTFMTSYSNGSIEFIYDATGVKLRKTVKDVNGNVLDTRDYVNGVEYNNGTLSRIAHTEGSITRNEFGAYEHQYVLRDHLGNTRVTFRDGINKGEAYFDWNTYTYVDPNAGNTTGLNDGVITSADIMQINSYYPFGLNMEGNWNGAAGNNKIQYNGKEWNDDFGLGWNDYGARFYDPAIGRWHSFDPMAEKYSDKSSYHYSGNNPMRFIDIDGMQFKDPKDEKQAKDDKSQLEKISADAAKSALKHEQKAAKWDQKADKSSGIMGKVAKFMSNYHSNAAKEANTRSALTGAAAQGISNLISDQTKNYRYENRTGQSVAEYYTDPNGTGVIPYLSDANRIHETVHAIQHNAGIIKQNAPGSDIFFPAIIENEVVAYSVQYAYQPSSLSGLSDKGNVGNPNSITADWVRGINVVDTKTGKLIFPYRNSYTKIDVLIQQLK